MRQDPVAYLERLCRPRLLVRAARIGLNGYRRERSLRRILPGETPPSPGKAFDVLMEREVDIDQCRRDGGIAYSAARHVEVLTALIDEAYSANCRKAA